ncbi:MAG TPA: hypothetical protein VII01_05790 [Solirubrobacteraceae bacterium]
MRLRVALLCCVLGLTSALACACGSAPRARTAAGGSPAHALHGPAFGLTEDNSALLGGAESQGVGNAGAFATARRELDALHPSYVRLLIDWAALQPSAERPPDLAASVDGCARGVGPCVPYAGVRDELAAIAARQREARRQGGSVGVVLDLFGVPAWAARAPSGCETPGGAPFARALSPAALGAYRGLIGSLADLARREGAEVTWWSPWNEPNDPRFMSPQRAGCSASAPPLSTAVYAELARAMASELRALGSGHHLVLGELNDLSVESPRRTSVAGFVAALPADVICLGEVWSIHAYAARHGGGADAVAELERALDARGECGARSQVWVTEAGAGAPYPGAPRSAGAVDERLGCEALARQLLGWYADPRVSAVFQYSFREDPAFPVGLLSADLGHVYPAYRLWLAWTRDGAAGAPPPSPASGCA